MIPFLAPLVATATSLVATIAPHIPTVMKVLKVGVEALPKVVQVVETIATVANVLLPNERLEVIAAKAMQADKNLSDFNSFGEYLDYLRHEVPVDEANLSTDPAEVLARQAVGVAMLTKGVSDKLDTGISTEFLTTVAERDFDGQFVYGLLQEYKQQGLTNDDLMAYIDGKLDISKTMQHSMALISVHERLYPNLSLEEIENKVMALR